MLNHADILHLEKQSTIRFCAPNRETRLDQFQLAGPLSEKCQNILLLATQTCSLERFFWSDETLHLFARSSLISHVRLKPSLL
jgi:hypothetical protein